MYKEFLHFTLSHRYSRPKLEGILWFCQTTQGEDTNRMGREIERIGKVWMISAKESENYNLLLVLELEFGFLALLHSWTDFTDNFFKYETKWSILFTLLAQTLRMFGDKTNEKNRWIMHNKFWTLTLFCPKFFALNPSRKNSKKKQWRREFLLNRHSKRHAIYTKIHSITLLFLQFLAVGMYYQYYHFDLIVFIFVFLFVFCRLVILRCIRPDKVVPAVQVKKLTTTFFRKVILAGFLFGVQPQLSVISVKFMENLLFTF